MQLLSKSKLPLKITKIFMVFVLFFSLMIQKPKETHAFPLALLLPAISNPAFITGALGVVGLGAVGAASGDWYNEKYAQLEQAAIQTAGQMSADMKENFQKSLQNIIAGTSTTLDYTSDFISSLMNNLYERFNRVEPSGIILNNGQFNLPANYQINFMVDGVSRGLVSNGSFEFYINRTNLYLNIGLTTYTGSSWVHIESDRTLSQSLYDTYKPILDNLANSDITTYLAVFNAIHPSVNLQLELDGVAVPTENTQLELDNINDYLTDQLANQNKLGLPLGINDLVSLKTAQGVPLYVDNLGQVVLRDGRVFEGDLENIVVSHRVPAVTDVAGTLTPTISSDFGLTNIKTGEIVIPNPNPPTPNPPNNIKPETTKSLTGIQRFLPAAVVIVFILFLKAIVFYAIRLFDFILTLPLTPSKPIDNYAFQWFMDAKILGIQVYDTVLAFAMFAFSLTIYKVIRRIW